MARRVAMEWGRSAFRLTPAGVAGRFRLSGEIDMTNADELLGLLSESLDRDGDMILDLSELGFIDSRGIQALLRFSRLFDGDRRLILDSPTGTVGRVLEMVGVEVLETLGAQGFPHLEV